MSEFEFFTPRAVENEQRNRFDPELVPQTQPAAFALAFGMQIFEDCVAGFGGQQDFALDFRVDGADFIFDYVFGKLNFSISPFSLLWSFSIKMKSNVRPYFCMMALQYLRMAALSSFSSCARLISDAFLLVFSISSKRLILRLYLAFIAGKEMSKSTPLGKSW